MNILPFVTAFIIILSIFLCFMTKNSAMLVLEKDTILGHMVAETEARNNLEKKQYELNRNKKPKNSGSVGKCKTEKSKLKEIRNNYDFFEEGKVNISTLINLDNKALFDVVSNLIKNLYH